MHPGQLGGDGDDVDGPRPVALLIRSLITVVLTGCSSGFTEVAAASFSMASRSSSVSCVGTLTSTVTIRSPVVVPLFLAATMPLPRTRCREPLCVPGLIRNVTR